MKKKNLKSLKLNKKSVSNFDQMKGGNMPDPSYWCNGDTLGDCYVTLADDCKSNLNYC
ncbi:hypothetical protein [Kordia sp.]|uniref:hypothetical protein n=1 Tax=Kordia sp. TaxID=1965332 RepID=UPI0025BEAE42|nr:hypothetical protein [Kordia sp.]MCH2196112.1 hypothetical protein [Kordia sp.]